MQIYYMYMCIYICVHAYSTSVGIVGPQKIRVMWNFESCGKANINERWTNTIQLYMSLDGVPRDKWCLECAWEWSGTHHLCGLSKYVRRKLKWFFFLLSLKMNSMKVIENWKTKIYIAIGFFFYYLSEIKITKQNQRIVFRLRFNFFFCI